MAVYVDVIMPCTPNSNWKYNQSCHMFADTVQELHQFAVSLGLKREWFQDKYVPHYDLTVGKRRQAIAQGAVPLTLEQTASKWKELGFIDPAIKRFADSIQYASYNGSFLAPLGSSVNGATNAIVLLFRDKKNQEKPLVILPDDARRLIFESLGIMATQDPISRQLYEYLITITNPRDDTKPHQDSV